MDDPSAACTECICNGHGTTCDRDEGVNCNCQNNTKSSCPGSDNCHLEQVLYCALKSVAFYVVNHEFQPNLTKNMEMVKVLKRGVRKFDIMQRLMLNTYC
mgnify:CR=1 FL=1